MKAVFVGISAPIRVSEVRLGGDSVGGDSVDGDRWAGTRWAGPDCCLSLGTRLWVTGF